MGNKRLIQYIYRTHRARVQSQRIFGYMSIYNTRKIELPRPWEWLITSPLIFRLKKI